MNEAIHPLVRRYQLMPSASDHVSTGEEADRRLAAQWDNEKRTPRSDVVIDSSGTTTQTDAQLRTALEGLRSRVKWLQDVIHIPHSLGLE